MTALGWRWPPLLLPGVCALAVLVLGGAVITAGRRSGGASVRSRLRGAPAFGPPGWFVSCVVALELPLGPEEVWPWLVGALAAASALLAVEAPLVLLVLIALVLATRAGPRTRARRATVRELDRELPQMLDDAVAAMASGASLLQGLTVASGRSGTLGPELDQALHLRSQGLGLQEVLDDWAARRPAPGIGLLADALALAGATGGSQVGALRSVGDTLRERESLHREIGALAAQARLSAMVLVVTPAAFAAVVAVLDHRIAAFLFATPAGWACLLGGAALDGAGAWWMRRLVGAVS